MTYHDTVIAPVNFLVKGSVKPRIFVDENGKPGHREDFPRQERHVAIRDVRPSASDYELERDGLAFATHHSTVPSFEEFEQHHTTYDAEIRSLIRSLTPASEVVVFDHTLRWDTPGRTGRKPVRHAHGDYTARSGPQRLADLLAADEASRWVHKHFGIIDAWRPINGTVQSAPLAFVEPKSLSSGDLLATDLVYPNRVGEIYELTYDPSHSWNYLSEQENHEVTLFKTLDSAFGDTQEIAPHTAFDLPITRQHPRPRHSIESCALVLFDCA
ncbi:MAG: CmcJ/NvfI family oxidoreductase [Pseudomonadota bacterium]